MLDVRAFLRVLRPPWRVETLVAVTALVGAVVIAWNAGQRRASMRDEIHWLRLRLAERRQQVGRQREELAEVASAAERLLQSTSDLQDRAAVARRLAHLEESHDPTATFVPASVQETSVGTRSEEAAHALQQLSLLDGQVGAALDSISVLTAILRERPPGEAAGRPSLWPVHGLVSSPFGTRRSPWEDGTREMHPGIDIQARYGMPVMATADGTVIFAGRDAGYGGLVILAHGGDVDTFYGHLSGIYVREGQHLRRGQTLGAVGASGRATGAHLHYEVRVHNAPVDPQRYLN